MNRSVIAALATSLLSHILSHTAYAGNQPEAIQYLGKPGCLVADDAPQPGKTVEWSGPCKDGYADGAGFVQWSVNGKETVRYEGLVVRGQPSGHGAMQLAPDLVYSGGFRDGKAHGQGILAKDGAYTLTAKFTSGQPDYPVKVRFVSGNVYEGGWHNEKPDGEGMMQYATGGSYSGGWREGKLHGHGTITYSNGVVREGEFSAGVIAGGSPEPSLPEKFDLKRRVFEDRNRGPVAEGAPIPFDKGYDALTPAQQRQVRGWFAILQDDDRPPFPLNGSEEIMRLVHRAHGHVLESGDLRMDVLIDENGTPMTATIRTAPDKDLADVAGKALLLSKFTPARCGGKPCRMSYPFHLKLLVSW